jgi:hypothetical protein
MVSILMVASQGKDDTPVWNIDWGFADLVND